MRSTTMALTIWAMLAGAAVASAQADDGLEWRRKSLREAPAGYLAVVALASAKHKAGPAQATLSCASEDIELRIAQGGRWSAWAAGQEVASGALDGGEPRSLFAKSSSERLLLGANGSWLFSRSITKSSGPCVVAVGTSPALEVKSFRLVAREPVQFGDDFPDPFPKTDVWLPVRGQWALSSVTYADQSANPAELAAIFGKLEDVASRGRTREYAVGIGVQLADGPGARIEVVANDSPAERAGLRRGDTIVEVNGKPVASTSSAAVALDGEAGTTLKLTYDRKGERRTIELTREVVIWGRSKRQVPLSPATQGREALIVAGYDFWTDYHFQAAVRAQEVGAVGLVFAYLGPNDYHLFRWLGAGLAANRFGRWQLERVRDGRSTILASCDGGFYPYDFFTLSVELEGDELGKLRATCAVDGQPVVSAADDALVPGRIGLWAEAPGVACFDDVLVGQPAARSTSRGTRTTTQLYDPTMRHWADASYQWAYSGVQYWHKAPFPGDVSLTAPVTKGQRLSLTVSASARGAETGYTFILPEDQGPALLQRLGRTVKQEIAGNRDAKQVTLARDGAHLRAMLDGKTCLEFTDPEPLPGTLVGAAGATPADLRVESPNVVEDYFNGCPTDWHVIRGHWEVMNRWVCNPTWSFFGGRNDDDLLAVWSKRRLDGDCSVEVDASVMMMGRAGFYENMRDLGLSLCAENQDLASGYAVIVGAHQNSRTILYRHGKPVASTGSSRALLPTQRYYSGRTELYSQHRGWTHVRLAKHNKTITVHVWDNLALSYEDPDPLPGGHVAVWSVDNGIILGKVRLAADRLGPTRPVLRNYPVFDDGVLSNDCCEARARIVTGGMGQGADYEVTNMASGGPFAVALLPRVFSAFEHPTLSFEIKLTPEAKVDLYFSSHGTLFRLPLGGPRGADLAAYTLPTPEGVKADGQWHRVKVDLLGLLKSRYPNDALLMVWEPMLANFSDEGYLLAGFGGNGSGAKYWLRNVSLASPSVVSKAPAHDAGL